MKPLLLFFTITFSVVFLSTCTMEIPPRTEFVLGTVCTVNLYEKGTEAIYTEIFARLHALESILSANDDESNIGKINASAGIASVEAKQETITVLQEAIKYATASNGAFDPTIGPLVKAWNIGTDYAAVPSKNSIQKALSLIGYQNVKITGNLIYLPKKGMKLDFGGIAKGYAADEIVKILVSHKIHKAIIDLGGNIYALGEKAPGKSWSIGIRNPEKIDGESILNLPIKNLSIVTSGIYERFFEQDGKRYHHILDTKTGYPVENELLSVTIFSANSMQADALSTTVFVLGPVLGLQFVDGLKNVEALFINKNHEIQITSGLRGLIKITDPTYKIITQ